MYNYSFPFAPSKPSHAYIQGNMTTKTTIVTPIEEIIR